VILVDTSAWIEFDRATGSTTHLAVRQLIEGGGSELGVSEPILMEVLAGVRDERDWARLRRLLSSFQWIPIDPAGDFEGAAKIYRECRAAGVTPRGLTDCLIAAIAIRTGSQLLAADRDFADIARVVPLQLAS